MRGYCARKQQRATKPLRLSPSPYAYTFTTKLACSQCLTFKAKHDQGSIVVIFLLCGVSGISVLSCRQEGRSY